jgi:hypothetical protein
MFQLWVELTFCQPVSIEAAKPECNPRCESDAHYSTNTITPARHQHNYSSKAKSSSFLCKSCGNGRCSSSSRRLLFCLIYFVCIAYFWPVDCCIESELLESFQDIDFEDLEQQQAEFEGKCPWHMLYLFLVSIYRNCMLVFLSKLLEILCVISFHDLSLLPGIG